MLAMTRNGDVRIGWSETGARDAPALLLLNSIGTDRALWDGMLPHLAGYRVIRMDTRGHGASDAPAGDYTLPMLAQDALAVLDAAGAKSAVVAGVSLGGMIAMHLALDHPERVGRLIAICTSATMDHLAWAARVDTVREGGMEAIVDLAMSRFLSPAFVAANPRTAARIAGSLRAMAPHGYVGCGAAIRDMALIDRLHTLDLPTLVVTGSHDTSTPFTGHGEHLLSAISGARHVELECAHLAPLEVPEALATTMIGFLR